MPLWKKNSILIGLVIILVIMPVLLLKNAEFNGADGEAESLILEIEPEYEPWFEPIIELPSQEIESLLFALQAAIGAGVVGYIIGMGKAKNKKNLSDKSWAS